MKTVGAKKLIKHFFPYFSLDNTEVDERLNKDVSDFVLSRVHSSANITTTGSWRKNNSEKTTDSSVMEKLTKFLTLR